MTFFFTRNAIMFSIFESRFYLLEITHRTPAQYYRFFVSPHFFSSLSLYLQSVNCCYLLALKSIVISILTTSEFTIQFLFLFPFKLFHCDYVVLFNLFLVCKIYNSMIPCSVYQTQRYKQTNKFTKIICHANNKSISIVNKFKPIQQN